MGGVMGPRSGRRFSHQGAWWSFTVPAMPTAARMLPIVQSSWCPPERGPPTETFPSLPQTGRVLAVRGLERVSRL